MGSSSASSTPKSSLSGLSVEIRSRRRAAVITVVPWMSRERMVMKNTMLKICPAPSIPETMGVGCEDDGDGSAKAYPGDKGFGPEADFVQWGEGLGICSGGVR